jgi:hypothetical protein
VTGEDVRAQLAAARAEAEALRRQVAVQAEALREAAEREARLVRESDARAERLVALAAELDRYRVAARRTEPPVRRVEVRARESGAPRPPPPPPRKRS